MLATAIMNAVAFPGRIVSGSVRMDGTDLVSLTEPQLRQIRGVKISLIGTNPRSKLNPLLRVGWQIADVIQAHEQTSRPQALAQAVALMQAVGVNDPERRSRAYPHELSGGMAQRILIAMALAGSPRLLIADEATSGLDVTVQRQVLDLVREKAKERRSSALIITHDLGIVAQYCQRVAIIYAGQIVEQAPVERAVQQSAPPLHDQPARLGQSGLAPDRTAGAGRRPPRSAQLAQGVPAGAPLSVRACTGEGFGAGDARDPARSFGALRQSRRAAQGDGPCRRCLRSTSWSSTSR